MYLQKVISRNKFFKQIIFLSASWRSMTKIAGSGSGSTPKWHGSATLPGSYSFFIRNSKLNLFRTHPDSLNSVPDHYAGRTLPRTGSKQLLKLMARYMYHLRESHQPIPDLNYATGGVAQMEADLPWDADRSIPAAATSTPSHRLQYLPAPTIGYRTYHLLPQVTVLISSYHRLPYLPAPRTGYLTYQPLPQVTVLTSPSHRLPY